MKRKTQAFLLTIMLVSIGIIFWTARDNVALSNFFTNNYQTTSNQDKKSAISPISNLQNKMVDAVFSAPTIKPNTSWIERVRIIDGQPVKYILGNGNPPEVALSQEEIAKLPELARKQDVAYMTPETELGMKEFLENPLLPELIHKCYKELSWYKIDDASGYSFPHDFSLENILRIDPVTGRKYFNDEFVTPFEYFLTNIRNPMSDKWKSCLADQELPMLLGVEESYGKAMQHYVIREVELDPNIPIEYMPNPEANSPPPPGWNPRTPHDGDPRP